MLLSASGSLRKRDQQIGARRRQGPPVVGLGELLDELGHAPASGGRVVSRRLAPGDVDVDVDIEEQQRNAGRAVSAPGRWTLDLEADSQAPDADAEYLHLELRGEVDDEVEGREADQRVEGWMWPETFSALKPKNASARQPNCTELLVTAK